MKATGIVRRIDDLGRVVIPKEIRRTLRIREGDPLEIFTDRSGEVILKKYSPISELGLFAKQYADILADTSGHTIYITDKDAIIAVAGSGKREFENKSISKKLEDSINDRDIVIASKNEKKYVRITIDENFEYDSQVIVPIISEGDAIGAVILLIKEGMPDKVSEKLAISAASFLGKQMEK